MQKRQISRRMALALAASAGLMSVSHVSAQVTSAVLTTWTGSSSTLYVDANNWNPVGVPTNASTSPGFLEINNAGTAVINAGDPTPAQGTFLNLGTNSNSDSGTLLIHGGSLTVGELHVGGRESVPTDFSMFSSGSVAVAGGTGTVVQDGGDVFVNYTTTPTPAEPPTQSLFVGDGGLATGNTANGSYTISAGTITAGIGASDNGIFVGTGSGSVGTFTQTGVSNTASIVTATNSLVVARAGATATYSIAGGTLNVGSGTVTPTQNLWVGDGGTVDGSSTVAGTVGTFTQTGGVVIVKTNTEIGRRTGAGSYSISGGSLQSGTGTGDAISIASGAGTTGLFAQSGISTVTVSGLINVGRSGGAGTYTIGTGSTLTIGTPSTVSNTSVSILAIGDAASLAGGDAIVTGTVGTFTQNGGAVNVGSNLEVGRHSGTGFYNMSAGTLVTGAELRVASNGATGNLTQQSATGTFTMGGTAVVTVGTNLNVGLAGTVANTAVGTFNMTGGTLTLGATGSTSSLFGLGTGIGTVGNVNISGGTLTFSNSTASSTNTVDIGHGLTTSCGSGLFDVSGTANVTVPELILEPTIPTTGTASRAVTVDGGTLNVGFWQMGNAAATNVTRTVTVNGGTLNATAVAATVGGTNVNYNFNGGSSTFAGIFTFITSGSVAVNSTMSITQNIPAVTTSVKFTDLHTQTATFTQSGDTVTATNVNAAGSEGGSVTLSGGNFNVSSTYIISDSTTFPAGLLKVNGGNLSATTITSAAGSSTVGGVLTETSGAISATTINLVSPSTFNYSGGSLTATTLNLNTGSTLVSDGTVSLTGVSNFTGTGTATATINVNTGSLTIPNTFTNTNRTINKTGGGALTISGTQANTGAAPILTVSNGTLNLNSNANGGVVGAGLLTVNANSTTNFGSSQGLATLNVAGSVVATVTENPTPTTTNKVMNVTTLGTISGQLDLTNNKLITTSSAGVGATYTGVTALVKAGRNTGNWNGNGIITSEPAAKNATNLTTLAVATGQDVTGAVGAATGSWAGQTVHGADTLVMYTYNGDANLDGRVNADDYFIIDSNYNKSGTVFGFAKGDFNYDGLINGDDYAKIDAGFAGQGGVQFAHGPSLGDSLSGVSAVPEPAGLSVMALASVSMLRRRRRHR